MSALPKITPRATPLPPSIGSPNKSRSPVKKSGSASVCNSIPNIYEVYPPRLPSAPDFVGARVNPLCPPVPLRRTVALETKVPHHHNAVRVERMKQREHHRYHNAWSKYYYGSAAEQEAYRAYTRAVLKKQMEDSDALAKQQFMDKVQESVEAAERDNKTRLEDATDFFTKYQYLKTFRDENKKIMEYIWTAKRQDKQDEEMFDREQMRYNPINWSCTLK